VSGRGSAVHRIARSVRLASAVIAYTPAVRRLTTAARASRRVQQSQEAVRAPVRAAPSPPGAPAAQSPLTSVHADAPAPRRHAAAASLDCCMAASAPAAHPFLSHAWHERGQAARLAGGLSGAGADSGPHLGGTRAERVRSSGRRRPSARRMSSLTLPWRASAQPQTPHGENVLQRARHEERKSGSFARIAASGATCAAAPVRASAALLRARRHAGLEAQRAERLEDLDERPGAERAQQPALQGPQQRHGAVLGLGCGKVCVAYRGLARRSADLAERETCAGCGTQAVVQRLSAQCVHTKVHLVYQGGAHLGRPAGAAASRPACACWSAHLRDRTSAPQGAGTRNESQTVGHSQRAVYTAAST